MNNAITFTDLFLLICAILLGGIIGLMWYQVTHKK
jgi:hypothetical protein